MKKTLHSLAGETARATSRKEAGKVAYRLVTKHVSKAAGKQLARTAASPWLLAADVVQVGVEAGAKAFNCDDDTAKKVSRGAGLATSVGIGASVGGPVGAVAGAGLWVVGEAVDWILG